MDLQWHGQEFVKSHCMAMTNFWDGSFVNRWGYELSQKITNRSGTLLYAFGESNSTTEENDPQKRDIYVSFEPSISSNGFIMIDAYVIVVFTLSHSCSSMNISL